MRGLDGLRICHGFSHGNLVATHEHALAAYSYAGTAHGYPGGSYIDSCCAWNCANCHANARPADCHTDPQAGMEGGRHDR